MDNVMDDSSQIVSTITSTTNSDIRKRRLLKKSSDAPKRFRSAYICYVMDKMDDIKKTLPSTAKVTDIMKLLATQWKALPPLEKQKYEDYAQGDKQRYIDEMTFYAGPMQVPNKRQKKPPGAPKRAMSAFLSYSQVMRPVIRTQYPDLKQTEVSRLLANNWKLLSKEEQKIYFDKEAKDREKYHHDMVQWKEEERILKSNHDTFQSYDNIKIDNTYQPSWNDFENFISNNNNTSSNNSSVSTNNHTNTHANNMSNYQSINQSNYLSNYQSNRLNNHVVGDMSAYYGLNNKFFTDDVPTQQYNKNTPTVDFDEITNNNAMDQSVSNNSTNSNSMDYYKNMESIANSFYSNAPTNFGNSYPSKPISNTFTSNSANISVNNPLINPTGINNGNSSHNNGHHSSSSHHKKKSSSGPLQRSAYLSNTSNQHSNYNGIRASEILYPYPISGNPISNNNPVPIRNNLAVNNTVVTTTIPKANYEYESNLMKEAESKTNPVLASLINSSQTKKNVDKNTLKSVRFQQISNNKPFVTKKHSKKSQINHENDNSDSDYSKVIRTLRAIKHANMTGFSDDSSSESMET